LLVPPRTINHAPIAAAIDGVAPWTVKCITLKPS
jgi:hypothetical protein